MVLWSRWSKAAKNEAGTSPLGTDRGLANKGWKLDQWRKVVGEEPQFRWKGPKSIRTLAVDTKLRVDLEPRQLQC